MRPLAPPAASAVSLAGLGFATAVAQAALLREGMGALGGSEMAWGAVLALWLCGMGLGAWLGTHRGGAGLATLAPAAVALLAGCGVALMRAMPMLVGAATGEVATTWRGFWVWALAVAPPAIVGGWSFPAAASALPGANGAATAYAVESGGAMAGGVAFTFLLAPWGSVPALSVSAGACLAAWLVARGLAALALIPLLVGVLAAPSAERFLAHAGWRWSGRVGRLAAWRETAQQRLELAAGKPAALYADGRLVAAFPDPYRAAPRGHLVLLLHPRPERVLLVGGVADGTLAVMLRQPVIGITAVLDDPALARVLPAWLGAPFAAALADRRVTLATGDPLRVVRSGARWNEIVLIDDDPVTLRLNRTRTAEFFRACAGALTPDGVLVVRVGVSDTYLGGGAGRLLASVAATLKEAFPRVLGVPGEEVLLVAGRNGAELSAEPAVLEERWRRRGIRDPEFAPELLPVLVDPGRAATLATAIGEASGRINRAGRPRAVLLAGALREARGTLPVLAAARALESVSALAIVAGFTLVVAALVIRGAAGGAVGVQSAAVVGFASMGWWMALLGAWQARVGSVYAEVGALSAVFMAGLVGGAALARRRGLAGARHLAAVLAAGAALSLAIAAGAALAWPRLAIVPMLALAGGLTGSAFPAVASLAGAGVRKGAGRGFAADEIGAGAAALLVGIILLPWAGMAAACLGIAALEAGAAAALLLAVRPRRV